MEAPVSNTEADDLEILVKSGSDEELRDFLRLLHPADIADLIEQLDDDDRRRVFTLMPARIGADVLPEIEDHVFEEVIDTVPSERLARFVDEMDTDDAADILAELPHHERRRILARIDSSDSEEIRTLLGYDEETAGGLMQTEMIAVLEDATVGETIEEIRKQKDEVEYVHYVFVVDAEKHLMGVLDLRDLLLADNNQLVREIIITDIQKTTADMDQEEVAALFVKYNLVSLPVVDDHNKLVGRIWFDDVMDVMEDEADEDMLLMAGAGEEELEDLSIFNSVRGRLPWLFITWIGEIGTGIVIGHFSDTLEKVILLTTFIPIVMAMGGNVGTQSATIVVRGIATGRINYQKAGGFVLAQMVIGAILGILMGIALAVFVHFRYGPWVMGMVTGVAMLSVMSFASLVGSFLPVVFKRLGVDPAVATAPFISTFCDIMGILIYLSLATYMLHHMG